MYRVTYLIPLLFAVQVSAQSWGDVRGTIVEADTGLPLPGVSVLVNETNFGTASDESGGYTLRLPVGRYAIRFSYVGFVTRIDSVNISARAETNLDITLTPAVLEAGEIIVEDDMTLGAGVQQITPEQVRQMPSPFKGFQALLVLPGVSANNELSNQYSVRGGGLMRT